MALSSKDREEAFDKGWEAAQEAEQRGESSLLANLFGQVLAVPIEAVSMILGSDDREEWRQEYERGYRAFQRHSENSSQDNEVEQSETFTESNSYDATSYHYYSNPEATAELGEAPSRKLSPPIAIVIIILVVSVALVVSWSSKPKTANSAFVSVPTSVSVPDYVSPEHQAPLRSWLGQNSKFRVATDADCSCTEDLPAIRQNSDNDHLYYAVEDFNADGHSDFAVVLVDKTVGSASPEFNSALAVFNGPFSEDVEPALLEEGIGTPGATILFLHADEKALAVCKWESECSVLMVGNSGYSLEFFPGE